MPHEPPTPPAGLPAELVDRLDECDPDRLQQVARYAEELAAHRERETRRAEGSDDAQEEEEEEERNEDRPDDLPDDVPSKATVTVKEINDNRYYYWQWREGERIESKYKGPVDPSD